jgi:hypothetical protein
VTATAKSTFRRGRFLRIPIGASGYRELGMPSFL